MNKKRNDIEEQVLVVLTDIVAFETAHEGRDADIRISEREDIFYTMYQNMMKKVLQKPGTFID